MSETSRLSQARQNAQRRANLEHRTFVIITRASDYRVQPHDAEIPEGWTVEATIEEGGEKHDQSVTRSVVRNDE